MAARPVLMTHYCSNLEPASLSATFYIPSFSSPTIFRMTGVGPTRNPLTRVEEHHGQERGTRTDKNITRRRGSGLELVVVVNLASDKLREAGDRVRIIIVTILVP